MRHTLIFLMCLFAFSASASGQWRQPQHANMLAEAGWSHDSSGLTRINVCWENKEGFDTEAQWVKDAIGQTWEAEANIEFRGWGSCSPSNPGVHILIKDEKEAPHTNGLGTQIDGIYGGLVLNFTFKNWRCSLSTESCIKFIAVHEFGHVLGLAHEQNRSDCLCGERPQGTDGSLYVTSCDMDSVMNYCNKRWNNYGVLSEGDKVGIRAVYGDKRKSSPNREPASLLTINDRLSSGQVGIGAMQQLWENVYVEIGGVGQFLHVDLSSPAQARAWNFAPNGTGTYSYRVWSYTIENEMVNGVLQRAVRMGYGEGSLNLTKGNSYSVEVAIREQPYSWNPAGYLNLVLR
jgi:hypothetical protein